MSNIHTIQTNFQPRSENNEALPSRWADSSSVSLDDPESSLYGTTTRSQMAYIDMNGEEQMMLAGDRTRMVLVSCCPCCVDPCGVQRRSEYVKSLRSMSVLLGIVQVIIFFVSLAVGGMAPLKQNPLFGPPARTLVLFGAKQGYLIQKGQVWRFMTPILLHAGIIHLLMNMLMQWRFALYIERRWGTLKFAAVYLSSGLGASLLSCLWKPNTIGVGASGALMGIMGGFLADILLNWHNMESTRRKTLLVQAATWTAVGLLLGLAPGVDGGAHLGGWFVGLCVGFIINSHIPKEKRNRILAMAIPAALAGIFLLVGIVCFFTVVHPLPFVNN